MDRNTQAGRPSGDLDRQPRDVPSLPTTARNTKMIQPADDTDTALAALEALANSSVSELRFLRVDESENMLQLTGSVRSFYHKQLAQEAVRTVAGSMQVINAVAVNR